LLVGGGCSNLEQTGSGFVIEEGECEEKERKRERGRETRIWAKVAGANTQRAYVYTGGEVLTFFLGLAPW